MRDIMGVRKDAKGIYRPSARARARRIIAALTRLFPEARCELTYRTSWELLVAVELSAQCTDRRVNEVTPSLFARYPTLNDYASANPRAFERAIFSTGFYRSKARNILAAARMVRDEFGGELPRTMREMLRIPGVGRKTANVVLGNAYGIVSGIAVDTHVRRLARLLGFTRAENPARIERDLLEIVPRGEWFRFTNLLIAYGRRFCSARSHDHARCPLRRYHRKLS